jgi:hypothetical protein
MTERGDYRFAVKESARGGFWIAAASSLSTQHRSKLCGLGSVLGT